MLEHRKFRDWLSRQLQVIYIATVIER